MAPNEWDYEQIRQLFARLAWNMDHGNSDAYAADYAEDGVFEVVGLPAEVPHAGKHVGREGVRHFIDVLYSQMLGHVRHWNQGFVFKTISDDEIEVHSYFVCFRAGMAPQAGVTLTGIYRDRVHRHGGRWYVKERFVVTDPQPQHSEPSTDILVVAHDAFVAERTEAGNR